MTTFGSQEFELAVFDKIQTKNPAAPIIGTDISATVRATIDWTMKAGELTNKCVVFADPVWTESGSGPLVVYDDAVGGATKPAVTVSWSVATESMKRLKNDAANRRFRWTLTPVGQLIRKTLPADGRPAQSEVVYTASDTVRGAWIFKPCSGAKAAGDFWRNKPPMR